MVTSEFTQDSLMSNMTSAKVQAFYEDYLIRLSHSDHMIVKRLGIRYLLDCYFDQLYIYQDY